MLEKTIYQHIRHNIVYLRRHYSLSQKSLAKLLGIGVRTLRKIEQGSKFPRIHAGTLCRLCDIFGIPSDAFLYCDIDITRQ